MSHRVEEVEIPCLGEAGTRVEPSAIPPPWELAMVWSSAGPSSRLGATHDLVCPCPDVPRKARFILRDEEEVELWDLLGGERTRDGVRSCPNQGEAQGGLGAG